MLELARNKDVGAGKEQGQWNWKEDVDKNNQIDLLPDIVNVASRQTQMSSANCLETYKYHEIFVINDPAYTLPLGLCL